MTPAADISMMKRVCMQEKQSRKQYATLPDLQSAHVKYLYWMLMNMHFETMENYKMV
jgi:hypothetical protein